MSPTRLRLPFVVAVALVLSFVQLPAQAQPPGESDLDRITRLEKENQQILDAVKNLQAQQEKQALTSATSEPSAPPTAAAGTPPDLQTIVNDILDQRKAAKDAADSKAGHEAGGKMPMNVTWTNALTHGLDFSSTDKDYHIHIGGWFQFDDVNFTESGRLKTTPQGIGDLDDGFFVRRIRPQIKGDLWDFYEFNFVLILEKVQYDQVGMEQFWVGVKDLPFIGSIRTGHVKSVNGLEADMSSSSRASTCLERSAMAQAIWQNQNVETGLWFGNHFLNDRMTYVASFYRQDLSQSISTSGAGIAESYGQSGDDFGDGSLGVGGRLTFLPIDDDDGRQLLHFGVSGAFRAAPHSLVGNQPVGQRGLSLAATAEIRDSNASNATSDANTSAALGGVQPTMINTGNIYCDSSTMFGLESLYIFGPLSFQAEYAWSILNDVTAIPGVSKGVLTPKPTIKVNDGSYMFNGGYLQVSYFLTGENRSYDRREGKLSTYYLGQNGPNNPFYVGRDNNAQWCLGRGAWSLYSRVSYVDLNDGSGATKIWGGVEGGLSAGVNWYLTSNLRYTFQYQWNDRYQVNPATTQPGVVEGVGVRMQLMF